MMCGFAEPGKGQEVRLFGSAPSLPRKVALRGAQDVRSFLDALSLFVEKIAIRGLSAVVISAGHLVRTPVALVLVPMLLTAVPVFGLMLWGVGMVSQRHELTARIDGFRFQPGEVRALVVTAQSSSPAKQALRERTFDQRLTAHIESATAQRVTLRSLSATHESPDPEGLRSAQMEWSAQGSYAALRRWQIDLQLGDPFIAMLNLQLRSQTRDGAGEAVEARMSWVMYETP